MFLMSLSLKALLSPAFCHYALPYDQPCRKPGARLCHDVGPPSPARFQHQGEADSESHRWECCLWKGSLLLQFVTYFLKSIL